ncbi:MAG: DUF502 domain-containing protein [Opitutaceae bacterium]
MAVRPSQEHIVTVRTAFLSGLLLLAPLAITIYAFLWVIEFVGGRFRPLFDTLIPYRLQSIPFIWDVAITFLMFGLITLFGFISHYLFGKYLLDLGERVITGIPGVSTVYSSVKQVVATFGAQNRNLFSKVVLVQYPRVGIWTLGFLTSKTQAEAQARSGQRLWSVFVPTSPNPTSGFVLFFPPEEITELDMSVGEGMKMVISGGAVVPPWVVKHAAPTA